MLCHTVLNHKDTKFSVRYKFHMNIAMPPDKPSKLLLLSVLYIESYCKNHFDFNAAMKRNAATTNIGPSPE